MDLKQTFIVNLRKYRNKQGVSQMSLADLCGTSTNYIGEIEIGRRFPSLRLIERIAQALTIEPYRLFMTESIESLPEIESAVRLLSDLPTEIKVSAIHRISAT
jgi:transcriptional regulator with XRE-family HTH domain